MLLTDDAFKIAVVEVIAVAAFVVTVPATAKAGEASNPANNNPMASGSKRVLDNDFRIP